MTIFNIHSEKSHKKNDSFHSVSVHLDEHHTSEVQIVVSQVYNHSLYQKPKKM